MPHICCLAILSLLSLSAFADSNAPLLLQSPTMNRTQIVFVYAGDLWKVPREGGGARRLTTGAGVESNPIFLPDGADELQPQGAIFGPKVMLVNEFAGSGGDAMPWYFRRAGVGKLIGKRTWGGLVGRAGAPELMDGGFVTSPSSAVWNTATSEWEVENIGIAPDIEVEFDPEAVRNGHDPQLEKAVEVVLEELKKSPPPTLRRPAYPNYHRTTAR